MRKNSIEFFHILFYIGCVQRSWTTLAGASPVAAIASEPRS